MYSLVGIDGNAFAIIGYVAKVMKKEGFEKESIDAYRKDAMSGDYHNLLMVSKDKLDLINSSKEAEEVL